MAHQLLRGDCLSVMKTLPDKSVDCFVCDLPYGQLAGGYERPGQNEEVKKKIMKAGDCSWDIKLDLTEFWVQVKRLCRDEHTPVLMFCNTKFGIDLINSNPSWFRYDLVWDKGRGVSFLSANKMPLKGHEMVYVFSKKGAYYNRVDVVVEGKTKWVRNRDNRNTTKCRQYGINEDLARPEGNEDGARCSTSVIKVASRQRRGGHPTEKPIPLLKWLLERYCPADGTVLDPTAGSFNTVLAAHELGLTGIGIEMNDGFYNAALDRLAPIFAAEEEACE
jgi:site-specific DNA-methyltransferase (adenine-specific)